VAIVEPNSEYSQCVTGVIVLKVRLNPNQSIVYVTDWRWRHKHKSSVRQLCGIADRGEVHNAHYVETSWKPDLVERLVGI